MHRIKRLGLIGGTGLNHWGQTLRTHELESAYGPPSAALAEFQVEGLQVFFLPRHGIGHNIPPHAVNYRANIDSLRQVEVDGIIAVNAVGGIAGQCRPGTLCVPDQLIDYTWGRVHSFALSADDDLQHVDFTHPFSAQLRAGLIHAAGQAKVEITRTGCLGVMQGPRFETAAEIQRLAGDGCDLVGMTSMPEAALAREAALEYACLCVVANNAASLDDEPLSLTAITAVVASAMLNVRKLLTGFFEELCNGR